MGNLSAAILGSTAPSAWKFKVSYLALHEGNNQAVASRIDEMAKDFVFIVCRVLSLREHGMPNDIVT